MRQDCVRSWRTNSGGHGQISLQEGPPCLDKILNGDAILGTQRFEVMLNLAVYLRKALGPEGVLPGLQANAACCSPPLPLSELQKIAELVAKFPNESYRCSQMPLAAHCDRAECVVRQFGVGAPPRAAGKPLRLGALVKYLDDDVTWIWSVNGKDVRLKTNEVTNQKAFAKAVGKALNITVALTPPDQWIAIYAHALAHAINVRCIPQDMDATQVWEAFMHFWEAGGMPSRFPVHRR